MADDDRYPDLPPDRNDPEAGARYLARLIEAHFKVPLSDQTVNGLRLHLWRVGPGNAEDLSASIFLECLQLGQAGMPVNDDTVQRAADRVRQRLVRSLRRAATTGSPEETPAATSPPDDEVALVVREFQALLERRSVLDALLFQRYYLEGKKDVAALAVELGTSRATVYRRLKEIRSEYLALRKTGEPPPFRH